MQAFVVGPQRMTKQGRAQVTGIAQIVGAVTALIVAGTVVEHFTPNINPTPPHRTHPTSGPTTAPKTPVPVRKPDLIIQQNVNCWYPVPGFVCGTERTYL